ncbi:unnamed protein product [Amoebophrya sp. A25]|nr:unnamed protein product [Amoebophrya sp. A25]|eukprot:GSA25T00005315001.1
MPQHHRIEFAKFATQVDVVVEDRLSVIRSPPDRERGGDHELPVDSIYLTFQICKEMFGSPEEDELDPISLKVSRSGIAQILRAARTEQGSSGLAKGAGQCGGASLSQPSRPMTAAGDRSALLWNNRPPSSYGGGASAGGMGGSRPSSRMMWSTAAIKEEDEFLGEQEPAGFTLRKTMSREKKKKKKRKSRDGGGDSPLFAGQQGSGVVDAISFDDTGAVREERHYTLSSRTSTTAGTRERRLSSSVSDSDEASAEEIFEHDPPRFSASNGNEKQQVPAVASSMSSRRSGKTPTDNDVISGAGAHLSASSSASFNAGRSGSGGGGAATRLADSGLTTNSTRPRVEGGSFGETDSMTTSQSSNFQFEDLHSSRASSCAEETQDDYARGIAGMQQQLNRPQHVDQQYLQIGGSASSSSAPSTAQQFSEREDEDKTVCVGRGAEENHEYPLGEEILTPMLGTRASASLAESVVSALERLASPGSTVLRSATSDGSPAAQHLLEIAARVRQLVVSNETEDTLREVLRALATVLDRTPETAPTCLLQFCRLGLDLVKLTGGSHPTFASAGLFVRGASSSSSSVLRTIVKGAFRCSKDEGSDSLFEQEQMLEPLLGVLRENEQGNEIRIFVLGCLKNVTEKSAANAGVLVRSRAVPVYISILNLMDEPQGHTQRKELEQIWVQTMAALRNLVETTGLSRASPASAPESAMLARDLANSGVVDVLTRLTTAVLDHEPLSTDAQELLVNVSRVLSKLSMVEKLRDEHMLGNDALIRHCCTRLLELCCKEGTLGGTTRTNTPVEAPWKAAVVLRTTFVLGNLCANSERTRTRFMLDCDGMALLPPLLDRFWQSNRKLMLRVSSAVTNEFLGSSHPSRLPEDNGPTSAGGLLGGPASSKLSATAARDLMSKSEEVLTKIVRLVANVCVDPRIGRECSANGQIVDPLLDMLGCKKIQQSEELVLNIVAAVTNLLYYDFDGNLLFQSENKLLLCRLFRPLLLESYNLEASMETARALGNLSRHADARTCMRDLRIDEILVIFLDLGDAKDLLYYLCGVLVNFAADPACSARLVSDCGPVVQRLVELLSVPDESEDFLTVLLKVLVNLALDPSKQIARADPAQKLEMASTPPLFMALDEAGGNELRARCQYLSETAVSKDLKNLASSFHATLAASTFALAGEIANPGGLAPAANGAATSPGELPAAGNSLNGVEKESQLREGSESDIRSGTNINAAHPCIADGCGRRFASAAELEAHIRRRHV